MKIEEIQKFFKSTWKTILSGFLIGLALILFVAITAIPDILIALTRSDIYQSNDFRIVLLVIVYCLVYGMLFSIFKPFQMKNIISKIFFLIIAGGLSGFICWFVPKPYESLLFYTIAGMLIGIIPLADISFWNDKNSNMTDK